VRRLVSLIILPVFSGLLLLLSFPEINLGFLAWIALVPLLLAIHNRSWRTAFGQGFLAGLVFYAGSLSWVVNAMQLYGHVPFTVSYVVMLLLAAYCALYLALFTGLLRWMSTGFTSIFLWGAPALWVALELARTYLFSGFPWALLGYSQYDQLPVIQIADITGVYGVSFLVVLTNILLAQVLQMGLAQVSLLEAFSTAIGAWPRIRLSSATRRCVSALSSRTSTSHENGM